MRLPEPTARYSEEDERERNRILEREDADNIKRARNPRVYAESNVTEDRTFDADTVAVAELADIVGTLIKDLRERKIIG